MDGAGQMHSSQSEREHVSPRTGETGAFRVADAYRSIAATLFCAIALIPSLVWVVRDRSVWPWDQAWYAEVSVDLSYLSTHALRQWCGMMATALSMKPPGAAWLGQFFVPLRHVFGSVEAALLFSILVTQLTVLILIYRIGVDLAPGSRLAAFVGAAAAASAQAFVALSHQYLVEPLQCLAVAWTVLIALRCHEWPRARTLVHLASAALLGMLAKASTPAYAFLPIAFIVLSLVRNRQPWDFRAEWRRTPSRALVCAFLVAGAFAALWYAVNYAAVLQHIRDASSGEIALNYGFRAPAAEKYVVWLRFLEQAFLEPYLAWTLGLLVLAAAGAILIDRVPLSQWRRPLIVGGLSAAQIALILFAFALNDAVETRYLYALLPYVAIVIVVVCSAARYRAVQALVLAACLAQWAAVNRASFQLTPVLANQYNWLLPIVTDATPHRELSEVVRRTSIFVGYNIVGVEEPWLNANSAAFFAAKNRLDTGVRSYYTSLGYAEKDTAMALKRIEDFSTRFVITLDEPYQSAPDFLNLVSLPVLRALDSGERFTRIPFHSEKGILIFERQNRASAASSQ
jgi:hypothetical protein